jgi:O-antigen/teichoic acid export membrane protein
MDNSSSHGLGRIVFRNSLFVTLGNFAMKGVNFLFNIYVVRRLGDDRFGQYSIVLGFVGLFQILAELGVTQYVMREIARDKSKARALVGNLIAVRIVLAALGMAGITVTAKVAGYSPELLFGIFLYTTGFFLSAIDAPLRTVISASERLDYVTAVRFLGNVSNVLLGLLFLYGGLGYVWLIVASILSILPQIAVEIWVILRYRLMDFSLSMNPRLWPGLVRWGLPFGIISLALTVAFSIDTVMLSMFVPDEEVGWYNVAYNLVRALMIFFSGFSVAIVPSLSRAYIQDEATVERWYHRSVKFILLISTPIAVGGMLLASPLIRFLYTPEYEPSALALKILIWDVPLLMYTGFCGNMTTVIGEERAAARVYTLNAVANVILNAVLIPRYGMLAASMVTVVTDLIGALQFHLLLSRRLKLPDMKTVLARIGAAALLMGLVVSLLNGWFVFLSIGTGALVYGALVWAVRLVDERDWNAILRLVGRDRGSQAANEITG